MDSKGRIFQEIHVVNVGDANFITSHDDFMAGTKTTDVVNLGKYDKALWLIHKSQGNTGVTVVTVESCDNVTPSTTTAMAFDYWACTSGDTWSDMSTATTAGFTTTAGENQMYAVEVNASELSGTDKYVRLKMVESTDDPVEGGVICILGGPRFMHEVKPTAIV